MNTDNERKLLEEYVVAKRAYEAADAALKEAKKQRDIKEQLLIASLVSRDAKSTAKYEGFGFANVGPLKISVARYSEAARPLVFDFVGAQGCEDIIKETIHPTTFKSFIQGCLEEGVLIPDEIYTESKRKITFYDRSNK